MVLEKQFWDVPTTVPCFRVNIHRNRSHNEIAFTPIYKGEKSKIECTYILSEHDFGLKLSEMLQNGTINDMDVFWTQWRVLLASILRNKSHNQMEFTLISKGENRKLSIDICFQTHDFVLKFSGTLMVLDMMWTCFGPTAVFYEYRIT